MADKFGVPLKKNWSYFVFVVLGYFLLGRMSLYFATLNSNSSPIWPATGLAIFAVIYWGLEFLPAIFVGAFLVNFTMGSSLPVTLGISSGEVLEPLVAYFIFKKIYKEKYLIPSNSRNIGILIGTMLGALVSALFGNLSLYYAGIINKSSFISSTVTWWVGNVLGGVILVPLLLNWFKANWSKSFFYNKIFIKLVVISLLFAGINYIIYFSHAGLYLVFLIFYFILAAFVLLPSHLAYFYSLLIYLVNIYATIKRFGPYSNYVSVNDSLIYTQLFFVGYAFATAVLEIFSIKIKKKLGYVVLAIGWFLSSILYFGFVRLEESKEVQKFNSATEEINDEIEKNLTLHESFLNAGKGYILANKNLDHKKWKVFVKELKIENQFKSINGIGFVEKVSFNKLKEWEKFKKSYYGNEFVIHDVSTFPTSDRGDRFIISSIEPLNRNKPALGLILSAEPHRRAAALRSLDIKGATITKLIQLVQDNKKGPGFLYYLPVYDDQNNFICWVYAPFIAENLFKINIETDDYLKDVLYSVSYDNDKSQKGLLYGQLSTVANASTETTVKFADTNLTVYFAKGPDYGNSKSMLAIWVAIVSSLLVLLIAIIVSDFQNMTEIATQIAEDKTLALKESQALLFNRTKLSAIGEMAGGIAHEINNPISMIKGKLDLIKKHMEKEPINKEKILDDLNKVDQTILRVTKIIKGLRHFSRSGEADPFENANLIAIIEDTLSLCSERFKTHGITLNFNTEYKDIQINCRSIQISQVILNLLNNAYDAIEKFDERWVSIEVVLYHSNRVEVMITDCGAGIPEELHEKILQPFFTTKDIGKGTGLGLSISAAIIAEHKGVLRLDGTYTNTRFIITLPTTTKPSLAKASSSKPV